MENKILTDRYIEKDKYIYLEAMRVVAIFFVIFNHTQNNGFFLFSQQPTGSVPFWIYLFLSVFCKFSVPLFFAISGALMLGRPDEPLKNLWKNRILKIAVILLVFSLLYYCNDIRTSSKEFVWADFFGKLYASNLKYHLWYLYAYIAYLVSIPFLKSLVKSLQEKYYYYLIAIALFLNGILPSLEYYFFQGSRTLNENLKLSWLTANIVLYPCLGYFLQHKLDIQQVVSKIPLIWILNVAGIAISCYMTYYKGVITGGFVRGESQTFHNAFVLLNCIAVFITLKWVFETMSFSPKIHGYIKSLGKCTFGIYLLHLWIKEWGVLKRMLAAMRAAGINDMVSVFVYCVIVMFIAYIITLVISKIPVLKRMVGF